LVASSQPDNESSFRGDNYPDGYFLRLNLSTNDTFDGDASGNAVDEKFQTTVKICLYFDHNHVNLKPSRVRQKHW
jgi:hypothetical protein